MGKPTDFVDIRALIIVDYIVFYEELIDDIIIHGSTTNIVEKASY